MGVRRQLATRHISIRADVPLLVGDKECVAKVRVQLEIDMTRAAEKIADKDLPPILVRRWSERVSRYGQKRDCGDQERPTSASKFHVQPSAFWSCFLFSCDNPKQQTGALAPRKGVSGSGQKLDYQPVKLKGQPPRSAFAPVPHPRGDASRLLIRENKQHFRNSEPFHKRDSMGQNGSKWAEPAICPSFRTRALPPCDRKSCPRVLARFVVHHHRVPFTPLYI
jgi:hypothetical protein